MAPSAARKAYARREAERVAAETPAGESPTFPCLPTAGGTWTFYCPACCRWHSHGGIPGHRVAHCVDGPYHDRGYFIERLPGLPAKRNRA